MVKSRLQLLSWAVEAAVTTEATAAVDTCNALRACATQPAAPGRVLTALDVSTKNPAHISLVHVQTLGLDPDVRRGTA